MTLKALSIIYYKQERTIFDQQFSTQLDSPTLWTGQSLKQSNGSGFILYSPSPSVSPRDESKAKSADKIQGWG